ncbi:MAG: LPS assembly protein LptD [Desulfobacterales bacterium]|jgi:LPS-assembly protein
MNQLQNSRILLKKYVEHYSKILPCIGFVVFYIAVALCSLKKSKMSCSSRICKTVTGLGLFLFILTLVFNPVSANGQPNPFQDDESVPWHIVADEMNYDDQAKVYIGRGNVNITKKDKNLNADYVRFNQNTMDVFAKGHVVMTVGENIITGTSMEMNLDAETGTIYNGTIFVDENHFYIKGDKIQKVGKDAYTAEKASVSTCDGDPPAWKITGRDLKVTVEGYGFVKHAALWAKKVPVLYTPFLVFPAKLKRQTGLLTPLVGYSDRKGGEYLQPLFWAINESSDATFYAHHMSRRGEKLGLEYRYVLDEQTKGTLMADFLDDRQVDDGSPGSEKWGYEGDGVLRPNSDRYWFRMKHDQPLPNGFFARLDIDYVSDQDYFSEFKEGYTGFNETEKYYLKEFGRGFDAYDDPVRLNRLNVNRNWPLYSLNAELRWYDDVIKRRQEETDTTVQRLPVITFDGSKQKISTSPFYFDLGSEYTYFYSEDGPRNHRMDVHPRFYLPYNLRSFFTIEPSVGLRETVWHLDKTEYSSSDKKTLTRELYDIKVDLSSEVYQVFNIEGKRVDRIKHIIRPQIIYDYIPEKDQSELPSLDGIDRIGRVNLITYSLTNTLTSKSKKNTGGIKRLSVDKPATDGSYEPPMYGYNEFLRFKLQQSYDINKEKEDDPEPFSPIHGELELYPVRYFSVKADADWSHYDTNFRSRNVAATIWDVRGDKLLVDYRYQRDTSETVYTNLGLKISDRLSMRGEYERNIYDSKDLKYGFGFLYETQCWSFDFNLTKEENDLSFIFMITLYGIGEIGLK